jgi:hypothetical protein
LQSAEIRLRHPIGIQMNDQIKAAGTPASRTPSKGKNSRSTLGLVRRLLRAFLEQLRLEAKLFREK